MQCKRIDWFLLMQLHGTVSSNPIGISINMHFPKLMKPKYSNLVSWLWIVLALPALCISESFIKIKIDLNFYFTLLCEVGRDGRQHKKSVKLNFKLIFSPLPGLWNKKRWIRDRPAVQIWLANYFLLACKNEKCQRIFFQCSKNNQI